MAGGVRDLAAFGALGWVRKLHLQPSGDTGECPSQNTSYSLKRNFPFHWLFSDHLLSGQILKERECLRIGKKSLGALKLGSAQIALAVQYNPLAGI
jgi:hypothetical protein